jgi:protein-serine/threonine kinase
MTAAGGQGAGHDAYHEGRQTNGYREKVYDDNAAAPSSASRSRRKAQQSPEAAPQISNTTREGRDAQQPPIQSRSQNSNDAHGPIRETTDILSRLVISQPEMDLDRERERMEESVPHPYPAAAVVATAGLGVVGSEGVDDAGRGGERRRQDHSTSKREKNTRFGEYFLGNTLGEGEFGKVKMGWKQEGGVQVS